MHATIDHYSAQRIFLFSNITRLDLSKFLEPHCSLFLLFWARNVSKINTNPSVKLFHRLPSPIYILLNIILYVPGNIKRLFLSVIFLFMITIILNFLLFQSPLLFPVTLPQKVYALFPVFSSILAASLQLKSLSYLLGRNKNLI